MSTAARIVAAITDDILHGRLQAGERLDEVSLAGRFETSRTPVREALNVLIARELLRREGRRLSVNRFHGDELSELFEAMNEIEGLVARMAAMRMSFALRSKMVQHQDECRRAAEADDLAAFLTANEQFHFAIYEGANNRFIQDLATGLRHKTASARFAKYRTGLNMREAVADHDRIVALIDGGEHDAAAREMRSHVSRTHMRLLSDVGQAEDAPAVSRDARQR